MDPFADIIASVAAAAALVGAIVAIGQARAASTDRRAADLSRDEAARSSKESARLAAIATDAFIRQAEAQEHANILTEQAIPKKKVKFALSPVSGTRWIANNTGDLTALSAQVLPATEDLVGFIRPEDDGPRDIVPGDSMFFIVLSTMQSPTPRILLRYKESSEEDADVFEVAISIPA